MKQIFVADLGFYGAYIVVANDISEAIEKCEQEYKYSPKYSEWETYKIDEVVHTIGDE